MAKHNEKLSAARALLALIEPFFSTLLFKYPMREENMIPTAAVDAKGQIYYNADYVESLESNELVFLLCHEVLHIVYQHTLRRGERNHKLWNIACDAVINETLISLGVGSAPKKGVRYPNAENMTSEQVYEELLKNAKEAPPMGGGGSGSGDGSNGNGGGWSQETDLINDGDAHKSEEEDDPLKDARKKFGKKLSESEKRQEEVKSKQNTSEAVTMARMQSKNCGSGRGNFLRRLEEMIMAENFPWYKALEQYMTKFVSQDQSWKRPNRRFSDVYLPVTDRLPAMGKLIIGIDTSGSISDKELNFFGAHINSIIEQCRPESITVVWCDDEVSGVDEFKLEEAPIKFEPKGGGGTDMREITKWVAENEPEADICIIFTDGYTPYPEDGEEAIPTQWVITTDYKPPEHINYLEFSMEDQQC